MSHQPKNHTDVTAYTTANRFRNQNNNQIVYRSQRISDLGRGDKIVDGPIG
jgi:hypothetical protein